MSYSIDFVYRLIDQYTAPLQKIGLTSKNFQKDVDRAKEKINGMRNALNSNMAKMIGWGAAITAVTMSIKTGIQMASDLNEVQNVVDKTFGDSASQINEWSQTAIESYGLSELQAKKYTGVLGSMMKSSGIEGENLNKMSMALAGLTGDFSSFYDLDHEEAFAKIRAGISGETEPLKQIGLNLSVANLQAYALSQGITKKFQAMTQAEQVMLRYNYLLEISKDAQGDFAYTLKESYANQMRLLKVQFAQKLGQSMKALLPVLVQGLIKLNAFIEAINPDVISGFIMGIVKIGRVFVGVIKFLKPIAPIIIGMIAAWKAYQVATMVIAAAQMALNFVMAANPIGLIIIAIGALIGIIYILVKNWDKVKAAVINAVKVSIEWLKQLGLKILEVWDKVKGFVAIVAAPLVIIVEIFRTILENFGAIKKAFTDEGIVGGIWAIGKAILSGLLSPLEAILNVASVIPKVGEWAKIGADKIKQFREGLFQDEQEAIVQKQRDEIEKTTVEIKKTRDESVKPLDYSKIDMANKKSLENVLAYKEEQYKARDKMMFVEKYVRKPDEVKTRETKTQVNANMNLRVYNETGAKVVPFSKSGNLGYNEVGQ